MSSADSKTVRIVITPGNNNNSDAQLDDGDTLEIQWAGPGKFCVISVSPLPPPDPFNQPLPHGGEHNTGHQWSGVAQVAAATVTYTTVASSGTCGANPTATGGTGTIKIGTGMPAKR